MACKLIEHFREYNITAIKITPHFHETTPGLKTIREETGYAIYEETNSDTTKDTSRMLRSGAARFTLPRFWITGSNLFLTK